MSRTLCVGTRWAVVAAALKRAPAATVRGARVTVAVMDSGLLEGGGGTDRILTTGDFTDGSSTPAAIAALDPCGHGTHVAGLVGSGKKKARAWRRARGTSACAC